MPEIGQGKPGQVFPDGALQGGRGPQTHEELLLGDACRSIGAPDRGQGEVVGEGGFTVIRGRDGGHDAGLEILAQSRGRFGVAGQGGVGGETFDQGEGCRQIEMGAGFGEVAAAVAVANERQQGPEIGGQFPRFPAPRQYPHGLAEPRR